MKLIVLPLIIILSLFGGMIWSLIMADTDDVFYNDIDDSDDEKAWSGLLEDDD